jgi:purine-cytosine permease-like protein
MKTMEHIDNTMDADNEKHSLEGFPQHVASGELALLSPPQTIYDRITALLLRLGIEVHGIAPIPAEKRVDSRLYEMFWVWFSANMNILSISVGSAGPVFFELGLRETLVTLAIVDISTCVIPAFFAVFGPKLGTRAMVQARFSWGYFGAAIPSVLNVVSLQGFLILNSIIGGQILASVSPHLNDALGIVIIGVITLAVTFCGYRVIHWYERVAWIPSVIAFIVMLAVGGKNLTMVPTSAPTSTAAIISFASTVASSVIPWSTIAPDYGVYHSGEPSRCVL